MNSSYKQFCCALFAMQVVASCKTNSNLKTKEKRPSPEAAQYDNVSADDIGMFKLAPMPKDVDSAEAQIAVSEAELFNTLGINLSKKWATSSGVLPQVLAPSVRAELNSNGMIAFLNKFPAGLGSALFGSFTNDTAINEKVSAGVVSKLTNGLAQNGGTNINTRMPINFDHFVRSRADSKAANIIDQAARWNLIWSINGFWTNAKAIDGVDHGLQLLGVLRTLSEWSYMLGLKSDGSVSEFGGLVKRWENGALSNGKPVAPNDPAFTHQIVTGTYNLSAPANISALDLATKGGERWSTNQSPVTLLEQASIWISGAKAFSRFRADHLQSASGLFRGNSPALSAKMGTLPLAFLGSMGHMLNGAFISEKTQKIFVAACPSEDCEVADARSVARLALALTHWIEATNNIQNSGLDAATAAKVSEGLPKLKKALQLAVRTLSGELTQTCQEGGKKILKVTQNSTGVDAAATSAEVIGTLANIERSQLSSALLRERIETLANGHVIQFYSNQATISTPEALAWNARMVKELSRSSAASNLSWLSKVQSSFQSSFGTDWSNQ